jgi:hypothetical protein
MTKTFLTLAFLCAALPVAAQQSLPKTSGDPLKEICTSFLEQGGAGVSGDRNKLCTCLVRETQARLTQQEMLLYNKAAETGQPPPPAIMNKVVNIATTCLTAAQ